MEKTSKKQKSIGQNGLLLLTAAALVLICGILSAARLVERGRNAVSPVLLGEASTLAFENGEREDVSSTVASAMPEVPEGKPVGVTAPMSAEARVNLNTATKEELMLLKGIGEVKAQAIVEYRRENGDFRRIDDVMEVSGIGEKTFAAIRDFITV